MIPLELVGRIKENYRIHRSQSRCAKELKVNRATVFRYAVLNADRNRPRPHVIAPGIANRRACIERLWRLVSKSGSRKWKTYGSATALRRALAARYDIKVSTRTVQRDLLAMGKHPRVRRPIPTRDRQELAVKRAFAREHRNTDAKTIAFSDESWITCNECTGRIEWVKKNQKPFPMERRARWNTPSAMVWACVGHNYKSSLIVFPSRMEDGEGQLRTFRLDATNYVRRCLSVVAPTLLRRKLILQQDGARSHVAKRTKAYLARKKLPYLKNWPPYSPDLNMIEPLWKELNCRIGALCPQSQAELLRAAKKAWKALPQSVINAHVANWKTALSKV